MDRIYVIVNPASGRSKSTSYQNAIIGALDAAGVKHEIVHTQHPGHAIDLAAAARQAGYSLFAAVGGDGTVSEVVNGMHKGAAEGESLGKLALFPSGSANDFVDMLGAPKDPTIIAQKIARGVTRSVDLGCVSYAADGEIYRRVFDNNLGIGFEAQVTLESYKLRKLRGTLLYIVAALRALRAYESPRVSINWEDSEGKRQQRDLAALLVSVGNSARTGGGFYLTPAAKLDDGMLDLGIAQKLPRWRIIGLLPKALFGKHVNDPAVEMSTSRHIRITCHDPAPMHLDGEVVTQAVSWLDIALERNRLDVIT
jgi:YegS/Rv2252/BmrU family lipid kinase